MQLFKSSKAKNLLKLSTHKLVIGNDLEVTKFCDNNGKKIGLMDSFMPFDLWKSRKNLYILCDPTEEFWDRNKSSYNSDDSKENDFDSDLEKDDSSKNEISTYGCDNQSSRKEGQEKSPKKVNQYKDDQPIQKIISTVQETESSLLDNQFEHKKNVDEFLLMSTCDGDIFYNVIKKIKIIYWITRYSKYPPHRFYQSEHYKIDIYRRLIDRPEEHPGPDPDIDDFDPQYGYPVSKIKIDEYLLFETSIGESSKITFHFANANDKPLVQLYEMMFDLDFVVGSNEGKWCIGVIPFYFESCNPYFTWSKDDVIYEEGDTLHYLINMPLTEVPSQWQCKITSKHNFTCVSKKIWLKISSSPYDMEQLEGVREIQKNERNSPLISHNLLDQDSKLLYTKDNSILRLSL